MDETAATGGAEGAGEGASGAPGEARAPEGRCRGPRGRRWRRLLAMALVIVVGTYAVWCGLLYKVQDRLMFPRELAPRPFVNRGFPAEPIELRHAFAPGPAPGHGPGHGPAPAPAPGSEAVAWYFPAPGASPERPAPAVVYFHGNAEIIDQQDDVVERYHRLGVSVLLPEYRGYGRSGGEPSQAGIAEDARAFYDALVARPEVDRGRIVYHGRSLGGGPAAELTLHAPPAAMVLESTFSSAAAMALSYGVPPLLVRNAFRVDRALARLDAPVLIIHGTGDPVIPVRHGRRLAEIARRGTYVEYDFSHDDLWVRGHGELYWAEVERFLREAGVVGDASVSRDGIGASRDAPAGADTAPVGDSGVAP